jgi:hypothetical protein
MEISKPNENGVLNVGLRVIVARHGAHSHTAVNIALCEDGLYRMSIELHYSYGGFGGPICLDDIGHPTVAAAETAGIEALLQRWEKPFACDPDSVHTELRMMREALESRSRQPSLL